MQELPYRAAFPVVTKLQKQLDRRNAKPDEPIAI